MGGAGIEGDRPATALAAHPRQPIAGGQQQGQQQHAGQDPQAPFGEEGKHRQHALQPFRPRRRALRLGLGLVDALPSFLHHGAVERRIAVGLLAGAVEVTLIDPLLAEHFRQGRRRRRLVGIHGLVRRRRLGRILRLRGRGDRRSQDRDHDEQRRRAPGKPATQFAEHDLHVPGFQLGAPVEVEAKPRANEEGLDHRHRHPRHRVEADLHPGRRLLGDQRPGGAQGFRQQIQRGEHQDAGDAAQEQRAFEMQAYQGQQRRVAVDRTGQHPPAFAQPLALHAFQQIHRQVQRAHRTEAAPGQVVQHWPPAPVRLRAHGLAHAGHRTEHRTRGDIQRNPVEHRLEPPHQHAGQANQIQRPARRIEQREHRQRHQQPGFPDRGGMPAHQRHPQLHRLPGRARAQLDGELLKPHRCVPGHRATTTAAPVSTASPRRRISPTRGSTGSKTRTLR